MYRLVYLYLYASGKSNKTKTQTETIFLQRRELFLTMSYTTIKQ